MNIIKTLEEEFKIKKNHIESVVKLIDEGNTIPFIARYRKEMTGSMTDVTLRELSNRLTYLRNLENRKEEVIKLIKDQDKLTKEIEDEIKKSTSLQKIDDLYRPFRPKRRTRATIAKEKGLEGLAKLILAQDREEDQFIELARTYINPENDVNNVEEAIVYAKDIIAEDFSDNPKYREIIKNALNKRGFIVTKAIDEETDSVYNMYYDYSEKVSNIANHRILAINRGEKEKLLKVSITTFNESIEELLILKTIKNRSFTSKYVEEAILDGYKRLAFPSIEREIRNNLTERAEEDAIKVFSKNLKPLILQSPLRSKVVLGIDPGFRTGCKLAVIDRGGNLLDYATIYPTEPRNEVEKSIEKLLELIRKHRVDVLAIGNGTASRETEMIVGKMLADVKDVKYTIVSEAGASIYSASEIGADEFPDLDVSIRGAISIARRIQDPMAELVKIEPRHIGVGQYQHDLNKGKLDQALTGVVEDCVNSVGVNLNTASPSLLKYVAGVSSRVAENIVEFRKEEGGFKSRAQLAKVKGLGKKTFEQCAGFLRIPNGEEFLDNTGVHPESYSVAKELLKLDYRNIRHEEYSKETGVGLSTLKDIINDLDKPGRDLRDEMEKPILKSNILKIEDLKEGMILNGVVRNVVDFGAFIDMGVGVDGLLHISQISDSFIKDIMGKINVGDILEVKVLDIDSKRNRIALTMKNLN